MSINQETITVYDDSPSNGPCLGLSWSPNPKVSPKLKVSNIKQYTKELVRNLYVKGNLFGLNRRSNSIIPQFPKCVIIGTGGNLGGAIISLPLIEAARNRWPNAHLAIVTNTRHGAEIVQFTGVGDSYHVLPDLSWRGALFHSEVSRLKKEFYKLEPEILIGNHDMSLVHLLLSLRVRIRIGHVGFSLNGGKLEWDSMFNIQVQSTPGKNWLTSYADLAQAFGAELPRYPTIKVSNELREQAQFCLLNAGLQPGQKAIAVQAGVWKQQDFKQWPVIFLAKTCAALWEKNKLVPVVIGALGQEQTASIIQTAMPEAKVINMVGKTSPGEAAALLTNCVATIANDSGLMHLSAAVGTPTVAIYGMTDPRMTWCYGDDSRHRIIRRQDCRPCYAYESSLIDKCQFRSCLTGISAETVTKAVLDLVC